MDSLLTYFLIEGLFGAKLAHKASIVYQFLRSCSSLVMVSHVKPAFFISLSSERFHVDIQSRDCQMLSLI
jgi:hypothetical protein